MYILTIRTDKPDAELQLFDDDRLIASHVWRAHHELAETLLDVIRELLAHESIAMQDVQGVGVFKGPGSFTGLRIGISVANALASGLDCPIVGATGEQWDQECIQRLQAYEDDGIVSPEYGSDPHITPPKK